MYYHGKFSFANSTSLLSLRGDVQPLRYTYFSYVNKPEMFPCVPHFTENVFPPKVLPHISTCNFHISLSIAAIL